MRKVDQHRFSCKMSAFALIQFKMQLTEIKGTGLFQHLMNFLFLPDYRYFFRLNRCVRCQDLADTDIRLMQRILFAESVPAAVFGAQTFGGFCTHINPIEKRQKTAVVNIRVRNQARFFHAVKFRDQRSE